MHGRGLKTFARKYWLSISVNSWSSSTNSTQIIVGSSVWGCPLSAFAQVIRPTFT